jgi:Xaa-Pro aminopeptidase
MSHEQSTEFAERRRRVLQKMVDRGGGAALLYSAPEISRPQNASWDYRQDSDLYYLTGCVEPHVFCLLTTAHAEQRFVLFVEPQDDEAERWTGARMGIEGATTALGADAAFPIERIDDVLPGYLQEVATLFCPLDRDDVWNERLLRLVRRARSSAPRATPGPEALLDVGSLLDDLRLIKSAEEQNILRTAAEITVEGHREAMRATHAGIYEYEVQAVAEYAFRCRGAPRVAYPSIVGSGSNATILHYEANSRRMGDGELLLIDAGAEYEGYAMDLTRTIPVSGRYTPLQRRLYGVVLAAEEAGIAQIRPGNTLGAVHAAAVQVITAGLVEIGLLVGDVEQLISARAYKPFFMHSTSHWIGLDIRDRGRYIVEGESRRLEPGMVFTVEPGLYIVEPKSATRGTDVFPAMGIRIEDTVLVTEKGCEVLTAGAPKDPDAVEALMFSTRT